MDKSSLKMFCISGGKLQKILWILCSLFLFFQEGNAQVIYVDENAPAIMEDGKSWSSAYLTLSKALQSAVYGDTVWVAQGRYLPTESDDRNISFQIQNGVRIYGGFQGNETQLHQRDWTLNPTILSGDIGVSNDSTDNSYTIIIAGNCDSTTVLDGLVIQGGNADFESGNAETPQRNGGGINISLQDNEINAMQILNCTFRNNFANRQGGAIICNSKASSIGLGLRIEYCHFENNRTLFTGGAIELRGKFVQDKPFILQNCTFYRNESSSGGALESFPTFGDNLIIIRSCVFEENEASVGGAMIIQPIVFDGSYLIDSCLFIKNDANTEGGAFIVFSFANDITFSFNQCVFDRNIITGIDSNTGSCFSLINGAASPTAENFYFTNCLFKENEGGEVFSNAGFSLSFVNTIFEKNENGCIVSVPTFSQLNHQFINCNFIENKPISGAPGLFWFLTDEINGQPINNEISFLNCLFWKNEFTQSTGGLGSFNNTTLTFSHSFFDKNSLQPYIQLVGGMTPPIIGSNNITSIHINPLLKEDPAGFSRIRSCSPLINRGDNSVMDSLFIMTDYSGGPRLMGDTIDIGAFEQKLFIAFVEEVENLNCFDDLSGKIILEVDGLEPVSITNELQDTLPGINTGLSAGTYSFYVQDADLCMDSFFIALQEPDSLGIEIVMDSISCHGFMDGMISATPIGGVPPYQYNWNTGDVDSLITDLGSSKYSVIVTDANGCTQSFIRDLFEPDKISLGLSVEEPSCFGLNNGSAFINVSGGTTPYQFNWNNGASGQEQQQLPPGAYKVIITDKNGCQDSISFSLEQPDSIQIQTFSENPTCHGAENGMASITIQGGVAPYTYDWSNKSMDSVALELEAGMHYVIFSDANDCQDTIVFELLQPDSIELEVIRIEPQCYGDASGAIELLPTGGTPPFSYNWNTGDTSNALSGLIAGTWEVILSDAQECNDTISILLEQPDSFSITYQAIDPSCFGFSDGQASVLVVGATPPYAYSWAHGGTDSIALDLAEGIYVLSLTDANACSDSIAIELVDPDSLDLEFEVLPATTPVSTDGNILIQSISGGTPPYTFLWSNDLVTQNLLGIQAGVYFCTITDANDCKYLYDFEVDFLNSATNAGFETNFSLFPNPAVEHVQINTSAGGNLRFRIVDAWGNLVLDREVVAGKLLSINSLPAGLYFYSINDGTYKKLIIVKN